MHDRRALPLLRLAAALAACALGGCNGGDDAPAGAPGAAVSEEASQALERGRALAAQGKPAEALAAYRAGLASGQAGPELYIEAARILAGVGRAGEAQALLQGAASAHPADASVALELGRAHLRLGQLELAAREFERAAKLGPERADAELWLGRALYERALLFQATTGVDQDKLQKSIEAFERGLKQAPGDADARYRAALAYERKPDVERALALLAEAVKLDPAHAGARRLTGSLLARKGQL